MLAVDLVWDIHNAKREGREDRERPSYSFHLSVCRAIRKLGERGLLRTGIPADNDVALRGRQHRVICWLPEKHRAPRLVKTVRGREVDAAVLEELAGGDWVDYTELSRAVMRRVDPRFNGSRSGWAAVAVTRSVYRLVRKKAIEGQAKKALPEMARVRLRRES